MARSGFRGPDPGAGEADQGGPGGARRCLGGWSGGPRRVSGGNLATLVTFGHFLSLLTATYRFLLVFWEELRGKAPFCHFSSI